MRFFNFNHYNLHLKNIYNFVFCILKNKKRQMKRNKTLLIVLGTLSLLVSILISSCNKENPLTTIEMEIHTFGSAEVSCDKTYPEEIKQIILPDFDQNCSVVYTHIVVTDKINEGNQRDIKLLALNEQNDKLDIDFENIKSLWSRFLDPNDQHKPNNVHILFPKKSTTISTSKSTNLFNYDLYYNKYFNDTSVLFYILSPDGTENIQKNIYTQMSQLKKSQTKKSVKSPWKKVVVCFKPAQLPTEGKLLEICNNSIDDDNDGNVDCEDSDCNCPIEEICTDGIDNDGDGLIDCKDKIDCNCEKEICNNEIDDDNDGKIDCADLDCNCPKTKDKCLIIEPNGTNGFKWNPIAPNVKYTYAFYDFENQNDIIVSNSNQTSKTSVELPSNVLFTKYTVLKVSCYRNGEFITDRWYKFVCSIHDRQIRNGCPLEQEKSHDCQVEK